MPWRSLSSGISAFFSENSLWPPCPAPREFLADASAVQFTRNPAGISGALKKIGGLADGSRILHHNAQQASHLFFANGLSSFWSNIFATHPPLDKRIVAIDPDFDGQFPAVTSMAPRPEELPAVQPEMPAAQPRQFDGAKHLRFDPTLLLATVGAAQSEHVAYAGALIQSIPNQIRLAMIGRNGAQAALFSLLLSSDGAVRDIQLAAVNKLAPLVAPRMAEIEEQVKSLEQNLFTPIAALAINSLKNMSEEQYRIFVAVLKNLIEADNQIDLFEYMLQRMVRRNLEPRFTGNAQQKKPIQSIGPVAAECATVFSVLTWESTESSQEAQKVFGKGAALLPGTDLELVPRDQCTLQTLDAALERLAPLNSSGKKTTAFGLYRHRVYRWRCNGQRSGISARHCRGARMSHPTGDCIVTAPTSFSPGPSNAAPLSYHRLR